jgi:mono/diheme cytochrome c family protein/rhodanese-related sulfurtransferase
MRPSSLTVLQSSIAAWLAFALAACNPATASRASGDDAAIARGASRAADVEAPAETRDGPTLYATLCAVCHGADGTGYKADNAPSLVNPTFLESASDEMLRRSIIEGRPGTAMAAYGRERGGPLDAAAVERLVAHLRGRGPAPKEIPARAPGDATRGEPLYAQHCERCHGTARARGNAVHLANARFLEVASDAFLGWAIREGRPGTPMEAWKGKLTDAQIDDVVAYVRSFAKPPPPELLPAPTGKEPIVIHPGGEHPKFTLRSTPCPTSVPCTPDERFVSADQVKQALDQRRRMVIIDARPVSDWRRVHIPGAVSIPHHDLTRLDEVPNDGTWVIAYCACPHHLSGDVVDALRKRGVKHAVVLDEGILEWHRRGYPVVAAPGVEPPPPRRGSTPAHDAGPAKR